MKETLVYIKEYPFDTDKKLNNKSRQSEIDGCLDKKVKEQKYFAYKLLEQVVFENFGFIPTEKQLYKKNNKWFFDKCNISISHSENVVVVALSKNKVGVDLELYNPKRFTNIESRLLADSDKKEYQLASDKAEHLNGLWSKKEAVFKCSDNKVFNPRKIELNGYNITTKKVLLNNTFYLSVAQQTNERIKIIIK